MELVAPVDAAELDDALESKLLDPELLGPVEATVEAELDDALPAPTAERVDALLHPTVAPSITASAAHSPASSLRIGGTLPRPPEDARPPAHARVRPGHAPFTVTFSIFTGVFGRSSPSVGVFSILVTTSMPEVTLPNTGCLDPPGLNQSR